MDSKKGSGSTSIRRLSPTGPGAHPSKWCSPLQGPGTQDQTADQINGWDNTCYSAECIITLLIVRGTGRRKKPEGGGGYIVIRLELDW